MDHALATLNNSPRLADSKGSIKKRDEHIKTYLSYLDDLPSTSKDALLTDPLGALKLLDPAENSIGYIYVLDLIFGQNSPKKKIDRQGLLDEIVCFLTRFDPLQIRYVGHSFQALVNRVASRTLFPPAVAVELLASVILRIEPTASMFTSTHLALAKLAIESNVVEPALQVLDKEITAYPGTPYREARESQLWCNSNLSPAVYISTATGLTEGIKSSAVLEYNFLRSLIYSGRRDWKKACLALEQVITHPVRDRSVSKIMVDCHKRWILVGLLDKGTIPILPSYTCGQPRTTYNVLSIVYNELAHLFMSTEANELALHVEENSAIWKEDGTTNLVSEVLAAYRKWQIINLRNIFIKLPVGQVRSLTHSAETGQPVGTDDDVIALIQDMLDSGMLKAEWEFDDDGTRFIKFDEASTMLSEEEFAREIANSHARIRALNEQFKDVNDRLSEKKEYIKHVIAERRRIEKEGSDAGIGLDSQVEDEDLMTGITAHG